MRKRKKNNSLDYWKLQFLSYGLYKDYLACNPTRQREQRKICRDDTKGYTEKKDLLRLNFLFWRNTDEQIREQFIKRVRASIKSKS